MQNHSLLVGIVAGLVVVQLSPAQAPEMNARDVFYSAADMMGGSKRPSTAAPPKKSSPPVVAGNQTKPKPKEPAHAVAVAIPKDPESHFLKVSNESRPLGLRYSILKQSGKALAEVKPDTVFRAGDAIRLSVMSNQKGFLYVISRGSSGIWTPLFPHPESSQKSNEIVAGRQYQVPGGEGEFFTFDAQAGKEQIFILLAQQPVEDLDTLISTISAPATPPPPTSPAMPAVLKADNRLNDAVIDRLRGELQTRDLVFTKVEQEAAAPETAVYVVKPSAGPKSRVMVDLALNHQ
ncbi:MAG: DUF4384 domain-containing protein [Bryobacteraceae bacterium]|nr:DUF4384 domain-containing protein [Bryobacteraceae bacterium]